ncbi:E3 ubiquitin-protein ligase AIRP2-like [Bidens hawaiensis]|uniref:E3 ubiquitin-protein ligase AIRP2-like n=1 Tax=Bidens hawaiensis TaxID=980011 RepID=UPI004049A2A1
MIMRKKYYKDSLKSLEADIQHANTLALNLIKDGDGSYVQFRLHFSHGADLFSKLFPWLDCRVAGALGLIRVFIYKVYADGKTSMHVRERKASMRQFYGLWFPSIMQLQSGINDMEERKQKEMLLTSYSRKDGFDREKLSVADVEREVECGICMEINSKVVLPNCNHSLCLKCYRDWHERSRSCPFCRESLKGVNLTDLWIYIEASDTIDLAIIFKENTKRLFMYIEKLPLVSNSKTLIV